MAEKNEKRELDAFDAFFSIYCASKRYDDKDPWNRDFHDHLWCWTPGYVLKWTLTSSLKTAKMGGFWIRALGGVVGVLSSPFLRLSLTPSSCTACDLVHCPCGDITGSGEFNLFYLFLIY